MNNNKLLIINKYDNNIYTIYYGNNIYTIYNR